MTTSNKLNNNNYPYVCPPQSDEIRTEYKSISHKS